MINKRKVVRRVMWCWWETFFSLICMAVVLTAVLFLASRIIPPHVILGTVRGGLVISVFAFALSGVILRYVSGAEIATREEYPLYYEVLDELMKTKWSFPPWKTVPTLYIVHIGKKIPNAMAFGPGILWYAYVGITPRLYEMMTTVYESDVLEADEIEYLRKNFPGILRDAALMERYMQKRKLKGVIAHELAHIRCKDVGLLSLIGIIRGVASSIGSITEKMGGVPGVAAIALLLKVVGNFLLPLGTSAMQLVREISADSLGSWYIGTPGPLIDGLKTLDAAMTSLRDEQTAAQKFLKDLFISHPDTEHRIAYLRALVMKEV
jgi:Zn-dependent protease with chaperone function